MLSPKVQPSISQVEAEEIAVSVRALSVVQDEAFGLVRLEPHLEVKGLPHVAKGGQLQVRVTRKLGNESIGDSLSTSLFLLVLLHDRIC